MERESPEPTAGESERLSVQKPTLRRELKGLFILYLVFAVLSCLVAYQCVGITT